MATTLGHNSLFSKVRLHFSKSLFSSNFIRNAVGLLSVFIAIGSNHVTAGSLRIEFEHRFGEKPLLLGKSFTSTSGSSYRFSRLDYLVSAFALQEANGKWVESSPDLVGLVRVDQGLAMVDLGEIPSGDYQAIRYQIGLPSVLNESDPNQYPFGHPLHAITSGLHWGWLGGYIFMALEGQVDSKEEGSQGYSYHLANSENATVIEIPIRFSTLKRQTVSVSFDLEKLFVSEMALDPVTGRTSTHSRKGDEALNSLVGMLPRSFGRAVYHPEHFQDIARVEKPVSTPEDFTTPYPLRISERFPRIPTDRLPTVEGVALGKRLFNDPVLSRDGSVSCASCHIEENAFSDTTSLSVGIEGRIGTRNAMPLFNLAWSDSFFWDGRVDSLAEQVVHPILDENEMGETIESVVLKLNRDASYAEQFRQAFGGSAINAEAIGEALAQYLTTNISQDSRFDRAMRGEVEFTPDEKKGFELFVTEFDPELGQRGADCFHCHGGSLFTDLRFANNGLSLASGDLGRRSVTGNESDTGRFKIPSLRNVELTGPYMHDGRFETLEEVIEHYNSQVAKSPYLDPNLAKHPDSGLDLSESDKTALIAFLRTLTEQSLQQKSSLSSISLSSTP